MIFRRPKTNRSKVSVKRKTSTILWMLTAWIAALFLVSGCGWRQEHRFAGRTMGTQYHITVIGGPFEDWGQLETGVAKRLAEINQVMSTYLPDSEISRINAADPRGNCRPIPVSQDMMTVLQAAARIYRWSDGAWDGTVGPLVTLWGFGTPANPHKIPSPAEIHRRLPRVGFDHIRILGPDRICKDAPEIILDLSSIAKGYAVDRIADFIESAGFDSFLVEIGGEVTASGRRIDANPWRVGISWPEKDQPPEALFQAVEITDKSLATSGDYRNFFEVDGVRYSHVLDPRSGYPVRNGVVSVSVLAATCAAADGLATALMVLGPEAGIARVNDLPDVECLIVVRAQEGGLTAFRSVGFPQ